MTSPSDFPLVSIITPVYNGAKYLDPLIASVRDQDYPHFEHIVIDDGSTDDGATVAVLRAYPHLRWWSRENRGQYQTMNEAIQEARGDYICFISADDLMAKGAIGKAIQWLRQHPEYSAVYGLTDYISESGETLRIKHAVRHAAIKYYPYFAQVQHCSLYVSTKILRSRGLTFNPEIRLVGDYDWILRMLQEDISIGFLDEVLSIIRVHINQISLINRTEMAEAQKSIARHYGYAGLKFAFYLNILHLLNFYDHIAFAHQKEGMKGAVWACRSWGREKLQPYLARQWSRLSHSRRRSDD